MYIRNSARAIIIDARQRVLLFRFSFGELILWVTPGGGIETSEDFEEGLKRELYEETGITFEHVGHWVYTRNLLIERTKEPFISHERYYYLPVGQIDVTTNLFTENEKNTFHGYKWWPIADILSPNDAFAPPNIGLLAQDLANGKMPTAPVEID